MEVAALSIRFVLASVFVLAALAKLPRRDAFARTVRGYEVLPPSFARPFAFALPPFELACGVLLGLGVAIAPVALLLALALLAFCAAIGINLARGREIDCGCMAGAAPSRIGWTHVVRNLVLASGAVIVALEPPRGLALEALIVSDSSGISHADAIGVLVASTLGLIIFALGAQTARLRRLMV